MCSIILDRTGVIEIGWKSEGVTGDDTFGTGRMDAIFHCLGTVEVDNDKFIKFAIGAANTGAPTLRNQDGILSRPAAVWRRLSRMSNICISVT